MKSKYPKIAQIVVGLPVEGPFDYSIGKDFQKPIAIGQRVRVSFNHRNRIGFIIGVKQKSRFKKLNPVLSLLDKDPILDTKAFKLTKALSEYYGCSWGEAIETYLPAALRRGKYMISEDIASASPKSTKARIEKVVLVHDQSKDKKWMFLIQQIQEIIRKKRSVIFLVPEVILIENVVAHLKESLKCPLIVLDRKLKPRQELAQWSQIKGGGPCVAIGTRSAIFAPVSNLGLIIISEEEDRAYKQEQSPHYHTHEVALMRAEIEHCRILFVSPAPSAEMWSNVKIQRWKKVVLKPDQIGAMQVIDMNNYNPRRSSILSFPLQNNIQNTLAHKGKVILFMNRLGFSTRTHCQQCGFQLRCERCDVNLIYVYSKKQMVCRLCNSAKALPKLCPHCQGSYLRSTGMGIEKLESEVARLYPQARVGRYDKESAALPSGADIIISTQAIVKHLDHLSVQLIAVMNFDAELNRFDFRSAHKAFSLLVRLRQASSEKLLIQTRMMDNYCIKAAQKMDFNYFYRHELKHRREIDFPPYTHLVAIGLRGTNEEAVFEQSQILFENFKNNTLKGIDVLDPHPDANPKRRDKYWHTILLKGHSVKKMVALAKTVLKGFRRRKNIIVTINVDP